MKRRDFIVKTTLATSGLTLLPSFARRVSSMSLMSSFAKRFTDEAGLGITSALNTRLRVHVINTAMLHSAAWEGSCRTGDLKDLTYEVDKKNMDNRLEAIKKELASLKVAPSIEFVEPISIYTWAEKGNPDIKLPQEQLELIRATDSQTDLYVVSDPFSGWKIAETYKKPVVILQSAGWGVDMIPAIRRMGLPSFHVMDYDELISLLNVFYARKAIQNTRILTVTNFPNRLPWGLISNMPDVGVLKTRYGVENNFMNYKDFFGVMDIVEKDGKVLRKAGEFADELIKKAVSNNMTREDIIKGLMFYYAAIFNMSNTNSNAFTIECFELCASQNPWNRRFTPCFTHVLLKDTGFPSTCESDYNAMMAMMVGMYISRKAVYMGNPTIDKKSSTLNLTHDVASLKMYGFDQPDSLFDIQSFAKSGFGPTLRHDFTKDIGKKVTVSVFDPSGSSILISSGEIINGGGVKGFGCIQNVDIKLPNGDEFRRVSQNFGQHITMVYGDYTQEIKDLGDIMKFEVVNIT
jgi:hypothetical protein